MGKTYQSIVINVSKDKVWSAINDFHNLGWAPNVVTKLDVVGDKSGTEVGAQRVLNEAFSETLISVDADNGTFSYSIDDGPSPVSSSDVSNYVGVVKVTPVTQGDEATFVEWSSSWDKNDEAAAEFCQGIYVALLEDMKKSLE